MNELGAVVELPDNHTFRGNCMFNRMFVAVVAMAFAIVSLSFFTSAAQAAPSPTKARACGASDRSDVQVDKKTDTVTVDGDTSTAGNNFYCYTNIPVMAGDTVTKDGTVTAFALIYDRDDGSATYSNLVIAGNKIDF